MKPHDILIKLYLPINLSWKTRRGCERSTSCVGKDRFLPCASRPVESDRTNRAIQNPGGCKPASVVTQDKESLRARKINKIKLYWDEQSTRTKGVSPENRLPMILSEVASVTLVTRHMQS